MYSIALGYLRQNVDSNCDYNLIAYNHNNNVSDLLNCGTVAIIVKQLLCIIIKLLCESLFDKILIARFALPLRSCRLVE